jgi:hypothetical protein
MASEIVQVLQKQYGIAWRLASHHLADLGDEECHWRPARTGLHVRLTGDGQWLGEWPVHEGYDLGPPSIAWLLWHIGCWWSMTINHAFEDATLTMEAVRCPGTAEGARAWIQSLDARWRHLLDGLDDTALRATERSRWPIRDRPFGEVVAWLNLELMKNAAELGYARFLYATR